MEIKKKRDRNLQVENSTYQAKLMKTTTKSTENSREKIKGLKRKENKLASVFQLETLYVRHKRNNSFKVLKKKYFDSRVLYPTKITIKCKDKTIYVQA